MKYIVYEVWTTSRIVEADSVEDALHKGAPLSQPRGDLSLCNWHVAGELPGALHGNVIVRGKGLIKAAE
jgi:hypothetical protein